MFATFLRAAFERRAIGVRITGQLIDARPELTFGRSDSTATLEEYLNCKIEVTEAVIAAQSCQQLSRQRSNEQGGKPTDSLDAYDCYLRGLAGIHATTQDGNDEALEALVLLRRSNTIQSSPPLMARQQLR